MVETEDMFIVMMIFVFVAMGGIMYLMYDTTVQTNNRELTCKALGLGHYSVMNIKTKESNWNNGNVEIDGQKYFRCLDTQYNSVNQNISYVEHWILQK